jgi:hypothetical protein
LFFLELFLSLHTFIPFLPHFCSKTFTALIPYDTKCNIFQFVWVFFVTKINQKQLYRFACVCIYHVTSARVWNIYYHYVCITYHMCCSFIETYTHTASHFSLQRDT